MEGKKLKSEKVILNNNHRFIIVDSETGEVLDDGHGIPNLSNKVLDWLNKNGWCLNGVKSK